MGPGFFQSSKGLGPSSKLQFYTAGSHTAEHLGSVGKVPALRPLPRSSYSQRFWGWARRLRRVCLVWEQMQNPAHLLEPRTNSIREGDRSSKWAVMLFNEMKPKESGFFVL